MTTQKPVVNCSVVNCSYWGSGNKCHAQSIIIDVDANAQARYDAEFAAEGFESKSPEPAPTSSVTCCHTFKPKAGGSR
ncbi:hypothetical protein BVG16_11160 [Paenibacillus selenitireducens]|uniref:DUF1540 domain-containing protein n=1 Tax=Paenibacillus selenitireducens TaxID=1324314 RepID=A0A1T2XF05_9BACL|nr:DUF1540 domain-containing protein [Paenibacillus selenitireducens]OPA78430.1 hypothetical protein BVG16_11160 [Paenibacillus selenitireducens]